MKWIFILLTTSCLAQTPKEKDLIGNDLKDFGTLYFSGIGTITLGGTISGVNYYNWKNNELKGIGYSTITAGVIINVGSFYELVRIGKRLRKKKC